MGNQQSLNPSTHHKKSQFKRTAPPSIQTTRVAIDRENILPTEYKYTKKDICDILRKTYDYKDDESIQPAITLHTDLECIEKDIFGDLPEEEKEFTIRLYISYSLPINFISGLVAKLIMKAGTNHLGVQICNKIVHWFDNSLVAVTEFSGEKALAIFPHYKGEKECLTIPNTRENRLIICKLIQKWNCTVTYSVLDNNCQKFACELFSQLGLNDDFSSGEIGEFINYISSASNKTTKPCYVVKGKVHKQWETHQQLDEWTIKEKNKKTLENYRGVYLLIKGFHRAYQARAIALKRKEDYLKELQNELKEGKVPQEEMERFEEEIKNLQHVIETNDNSHIGFSECPMGNVTSLELGLQKEKHTDIGPSSSSNVVSSGN